MSERVTFKTVSCAIKLGRVVGAADKHWRAEMKNVTSFIDALMRHMDWPDELWSFGTTPKFGYNELSGLIDVTLELKAHKDADPVTIVLEFQPNSSGGSSLVGHNRKAMSASRLAANVHVEEATDALNKASEILLYTVTEALSR